MLKKYAFQPFAMMIVILIVVASLIGMHPATPAKAAAVKIMALGDSITGSPGCWRAILWNKLISNGFTNFQPVGTLSPAGCANDIPNDNHEGHGGFLATGIANQNQLPPWLAATTPDVVLMHLGTNDSFNAANTVPLILAAYTTMVNQMRASNPNMKILVAQIIPLYTATTQCTDCYQRVIDLNAAIPGWAAGLSTAQSPITVVDQWTGFNTLTDTGDGIHPNDLGIQKMADKWYPAVVAVLGGTPLPTATRTATSAVTNTPTRTLTPVITNTPSRTFTRTNTPAVSNTPTSGASPTRTSTTGPTSTKTNTPFPVTPTRTFTPVPTTSGSTCSPVTSTITAPFTFDGAGAFCWQSSNLGAYINSWNNVSVTLNGVNVTNLYVAAGSYPAKINGFWYISYNSTVAWGHFEAK
jgi:lysophospholipase L1-like esterase